MLKSKMYEKMFAREYKKFKYSEVESRAAVLNGNLKGLQRVAMFI